MRQTVNNKVHIAPIIIHIQIPDDNIIISGTAIHIKNNKNRYGSFMSSYHLFEL